MNTHAAHAQRLIQQLSQRTGDAKTASTNKVNNSSARNTGNKNSSLQNSLASGSYVNQATNKYFKANDKDRSGQLTRDEVTLSAEAYAKLDADSNGKVTKAELQKALKGKDSDIYQYYKSGGEKTHSKDVVATLLSNAGGSGDTISVAKAASRYIRERDTNKDGRLQRLETTLSVEEFAKLDANADGKLAKVELEKALKDKQAAINDYYASGGEKAHAEDMAATVLFASNAGSAGGASNAGSTGSVATFVSRYIKERDKNKDGRLSRLETTLSAEEFAKLNTNADGKLTKDELEKALDGKKDAIDQYYQTGGGQTHDEDMAATVLFTSNAGAISDFSGLAAARFLKDRDKNRNGTISAAEASLSTKAFAKVDKNRDRRLSESELNAALADKSAAIKAYYKNGGTNSLSQVAASMMKVV